VTVEILVNAIAHRKAIKGQLIHIQDTPASWGNREGPPGYVIARVTGATKAQVENFLEKTRNVFNYSHTTALGVHQVTVSTTVPVISLGGGFKLKAKEYLEDVWGATFVSWTPPNGPAVFEVSDNINLQEMKDDVLDKMEEKLGPRYHFSSADVDTAIAAGGLIQLTKAQALNRIVDRIT